MFNLTNIELGIMTSKVPYVYAYYASDSSLPFYVGKGTKSRCLSHVKQAVAGKSDVNNRIKSGILRNIIFSGVLPVMRLEC